MIKLIKNMFSRNKRKVEREELKRMVLEGKDISKVDYSHIDDMEYLFATCKEIKDFPKIDFTNVKNTRYMFYGCENLYNVPDLCLPEVLDTSFMFENCNTLKSVGDMILPKTKTTESMFEACPSLRTVGEIQSPKSVNMSSMFSNCNTLISIKHVNTSSAEMLNGMFWNSYSFPKEQLPWDFSNTRRINFFTNNGEKFMGMLGVENIIGILKRTEKINEFEYETFKMVNPKKSTHTLSKIIEKNIVF